MQSILEVKHVTKAFYEHGRHFTALDDISLTVGEGECVGIVGESGSGKSTLARIITRLLLPDSGTVTLCGTELTQAKEAVLRRAYHDMKMIFQEPRSSFDPCLTLGESICEALKPVMVEKKSTDGRGKTSACRCQPGQTVSELLSKAGKRRGMPAGCDCQSIGAKAQTSDLR